MKKIIVIILCIIYACLNGYSQKNEKSLKEKLLEATAQNACDCIDSISVDKSKPEINREVNKCIDKQMGPYQMGSKLMSIDDLKLKSEEKDVKKQTSISVNTDKNSDEYKKYYLEMEKYLMDSCSSLKEKIASNDVQGEKSMSTNTKALDFYKQGLEEMRKENFKKAIVNFESAIKIDPQFAFAWDNIGISYRKLENYDKALEAYKKSLEIDSKGLMALQNIAIVYQYKKEYQNAIKAYEKLIDIDKNDPEIYYGIGQIYAVNLQDLEKGLGYMCKAYNLYIAQKSPYRTDAESLIKTIYVEMKKLGKENKFDEILKANNISIK